jgi:hypothetical protein
MASVSLVLAKAALVSGAFAQGFSLEQGHIPSIPTLDVEEVDFVDIDLDGDPDVVLATGGGQRVLSGSLLGESRWPAGWYCRILR